MVEVPVLALPDMNKTFYMQTDASLFGAGAVLFQFSDDATKKVVSYASWLFNDQQRKYHTTERELFAIILVTRKWKPFLGYTRFMAETDHEALTGFMKLDDPHGKIARWIVELNHFNFELKYIKGALNVSADALSRCQDKNDNLEVVCSLTTHEFEHLLESNEPIVRPSKVLSRYFDENTIEQLTEFEFESNCSIEEFISTNVINH